MEGLRIDQHAGPNLLDSLDDHALAGLDALAERSNRGRTVSPSVTGRMLTLLSPPTTANSRVPCRSKTAC